VRAFPVFISLMTTDIQSAYAYLKSKGVTILRDIISDQSWGGSDLHIADPDGNGIQVVQYS
jgi:predicted enzyme related to lactoylglutathione lyase